MIINSGVRCPEDIVFGLDIGTRNIVGTVGYMTSSGFKALAIVSKEHETRAMLDGQIHDINKVGETIQWVKHSLEQYIGRQLKEVCIAAAGRVLKTMTVHEEYSFEEDTRVTAEHIYTLELLAVEKAHKELNAKNDKYKFYCVGYTPVKYYLNDYIMGNLEGHKAEKIAVDLIATFLPEEVVDGLYAAVDCAGLTVANLTLEPIAAMNVAIPEQFRLLNIGLVDVGAGTSDICITKDGSITAYGMIPSAGDEMTETIAKTYLVDFVSAEKIKIAATKKKSITYKDVLGFTNKITSEEVQELLAEQVDRLTKNIAAKICELNGDKSVKAVFVVGGGGKFPGFVEKLAAHLGIPAERVALRGEEVLGNIEFLMEGVKKDPLLVTPIGICINYYNQKNNFIFATVNGERIKLYDNNHLTIVDAVIQAGMPNDCLFPRRGKELVFTVNGKTRLVRGDTGEAAVIRLNGADVGINEKITRNAIIEIKESTAGAEGYMTIGELEEYKSTINFRVNDINITCPKFAYVNGVMQPADYQIQQNDDIIMGNYYRLKQLFDFMDISLEGKKVLVNNMQATEETIVYENFDVKYTEADVKSFADLEEPEQEDLIRKEYKPEMNVANRIEQDNNTNGFADDISGNIDISVSNYRSATYSSRGLENESVVENTPVEPVRNTVPTTIMVMINGSRVYMSGKPYYRFVDIFDFYPFDLTKTGGVALVTNVNGKPAMYMQEIFNGDNIDLYWK